MQGGTVNKVIGGFRRGGAALGILAGLLFAAPAGAGPDWAGELGIDPSTRTVGTGGGTRGLSPTAVPEIFGPGKVTTYCNVWMKVTNIGVLGNPFTNTSSDPSGQWPGASGVEYLFFAGLWVGAKDPTIADPTLVRRVSQTTEWRPPTVEDRDHIYTTF
jgi:hypothetical protein